MYTATMLKSNPRPIRNELIREVMESFTRTENFWFSTTRVDLMRNFVLFRYKSSDFTLEWTFSRQQLAPSARPVKIVGPGGQHYTVPVQQFKIFLYRRMVAEARKLYPGTRWNNKDEMATSGWLSIIETAERAWSAHLDQKEKNDNQH